MAKKEESAKIVLERVYTIPLRIQTLKVAPFKKANKAVRTVKQFISRHMKSEEIVIGKYLNLNIWVHGAKNPPGKVKVNVSKDDKGKVMVELFGAPKEKPKAEEKKLQKEKPKGQDQQKTEEKLEKIEEAKQVKAEDAKKIEQEEIIELKNEQKEHVPKHHAPKALPKQKIQEQHPVAPRRL